MPEAEKQGHLGAKAEIVKEASEDQDLNAGWKSHHPEKQKKDRNKAPREFEKDDDVRYTDSRGVTHHLAIAGHRPTSNGSWEYQLRDKTIQQNSFRNGEYIAERLLAQD